MEFTPMRELPQTYSHTWINVFQTFSEREQERQLNMSMLFCRYAIVAVKFVCDVQRYMFFLILLGFVVEIYL